MCRAALPNSAVLDQGGSAALRRWPGASAALSLRRHARRAPGHTSVGLAISRLTRQVRHRRCRRLALLLWLSSSPPSGASEIIPAG
jgi:hypothetical protein